jgi:hypothetical protein
MSDWTKTIKGAAPAAPAAPNLATASAVSPERVRSVFGGSKPAPKPAEVSPYADVPQASAPVVPTYDEPPMLDDATKALLKAKASEAGAAILSGIGKGASATFAKAKAARAEHGPRVSSALAELRHQPIARATKVACGGVIALALLASMGIEFHAHRGVPVPTVVAVTPQPPAPVTPPKPVTPALVAPVANAPVPAPFQPGQLTVVSSTHAPLVALAAPVTAVAPAVTAPATCAFSGTVQTSAGAPIAGAHVAMDKRGSFRAPVVTDGQGGFTFTNTPGATLYSLQVQAAGMRTVRLASPACVAGQVVVLEPVATVATVAKAQVVAVSHARVAGGEASPGKGAKAPMPAWQAKGNADLDAFAKHLQAHENAGGH